MSKPFTNPSLLTKDRLKRELESNGIKLPRGEQKKDVYVKLYEENVSPKSTGRSLGNGEFSSDDDNEEPEQTKEIIPRSGRSIRKVGSKEIISAEIKSMTNEELKEELSGLGQTVGPILPSTRALYEQKLARLQTSSPNNAGTIAIVTKPGFSDDNDSDEGPEQEEESIPNDEFFYGGRNQESDNFGSTFSKNFENSSTKKEVVHDFSVSSSRNVERSSTFDRKTINKVRSKKGDKFEEKSWSSSGDNGKDEEDRDGSIDTNRLPTSLQKALTAARRSTPEKENGTGIRARHSWQLKPEQVPEKQSRRDVQEKPMEEDKKKKKSGTNSRKWWILLVILLLLIILVVAVVYNLEHLPIMQQLNILSPNSNSAKSPKNVTTSL